MITQEEIRAKIDAMLFGRIDSSRSITIHTNGYGVDSFNEAFEKEATGVTRVYLLKAHTIKLPRFIKMLPFLHKSKYTGRYFKRIKP